MNPTDLRGELARIGARWLRLALAYGVLRLLAYSAVGCVVLYALDRIFGLPPAMRLLLLGAAVVGLVVSVRRFVVYPLRKAPSERDVACAIERRFPEFDGRLLSVLELEGEALAVGRNVSVALVDELRRETAAIRDGVAIEGIFEYRPLKRVGAAAGAGLLVVLAFVVIEPVLAGLFVRRLFGSAERWPQRTMLIVTLPDQGTHFVPEFDGDRVVRVRVARGASLPIAVRVEGEDPESVELVAEDESGRESAVSLSSTGDREWAGRFRSVRESFRFRARGGDDDGEGREIDVTIFAPPAVGEIVTELAFPAYTRLDSRREPRGDIEAPIGTRVAIEITTPEPVAGGRLVFDSGLPPIELTNAGDAARPFLAANFDVRQSCAYSIELVGESGFKNLEPPTFAVLAIKDRAPTVRVLEPSRADIDVTPDGIVPLRLAADDDYGIASLIAEWKPFGAEAAEIVDFPATDAAADPRRRLEYTHYDLRGRSFARADGARAMMTGESLVYRVIARDNYADPTVPESEAKPNETIVTERRVDVVSGSEKLRLLTERQIRTKDEVRALRALQAEKLERLESILKDFEQNEGDTAVEVDDLAALEIGQNQITTRSLKLGREFAEIFEEYLLNRLDPSAGSDGLIAIVFERKRSSTAIDGFDVALWRPLIEAHASGTYGRLDVLGRLFEMLGCGVAVADVHAPAAAKALSEARVAIEPSTRPASLRAAAAAERSVLEQLDLLLTKLDEWENFQEILGMFRALIDEQRDLNERTRRALK
jgi:hypothetical protein